MNSPAQLPEIAGLIPLSAPQAAIWSEQILHGDSPLYNIGGYLQVDGPVDALLFEQAVRWLVHKHDALRTVLVAGRQAGAAPMQGFASEMAVPAPFVDLSLEPTPHEASLRWMRQRFTEPFALQGQPLFRYALLKLAPDSFRIFANYHHLIADGWSVGLLARSLAAIYTALAAGSDFHARAPSYRAFVEARRAYAASPALDAHRRCGAGESDPACPPLFAARHRPAQAADGIPGWCGTLSLPRDWYDRVGEMARLHGGTAFHAVVAALYVYFTRTEQRDGLVMGLPSLNRPGAAFKATAGLFAGVAVTRFEFGKALSFGDLLHRIGRQLRQDYRRRRFPPGPPDSGAGSSAAGGRQRSFDIGLSYGRHDHGVRFGPSSGTVVHLANAHLPHPLMVYVCEFHGDAPVQIDFVFNRAYWQEDEAAAVQRRLLHVLHAAMEAPGIPVRDLPMLTREEAVQIEQWNRTACSHAEPDSGLLARFDAQVRRHAGRPAVVAGESEVTYGELDARANRLARHLLSRHALGPDSIVGLLLGRSIDMVVGILAVLKAGAAYLPLDPTYPRERLSRTLEDARPSLLVSRRDLPGRLPDPPVPTVFIDGDHGEIGKQSTHPVDCAGGAGDLAYVIYTSGSTGRPKGVAVSRANLLHLMNAQRAHFPDPVERFLMTWSFAFDGSVFGVFWTLSSGGTLFLASDREHNDVEAAAKLIERHAITHLLAIPSFHALLLEGAEPWKLASLSTVMVAGEACGASLVRQHHAKLPQARLFNGYGPTEGCVWSTFHLCDPGHEAASVPIGKPIENMRIHVLDECLQPVPVGVAGGIYISGEGVARGYLRNVDLTAENFLPLPFAGRPGERMYRTGDLGRWTPAGELEFLGRTDHQVKVRGFRIELPDIEAALLAQPMVREAAVLLLEETPGDQRLAAYVVLRGEAPPAGPGAMRQAAGALGAERPAQARPDARARAEAARLLRRGVERSLPRHMVPHHVVLLDDMPRTSNGKVDRKALPRPRRDHAEGRHVAPATPREAILAGIWADLLRVERVGRDDNFFELGGHSLLAVTLIQRMRESGFDADAGTLFTAPTLADFAAATRWVSEAPGAASDGAVPQPPLVALSGEAWNRIAANVPGGIANVQDAYPLGPEQEGLLAHCRGAVEGDPYSTPALFAADGPARVESLLQALQALIDRHDVLRTALLWEGLPQPLQVVLRRAPLPVEWLDLDPADGAIDARLKARFAQHRHRMDVRRAPLLRAVVAQDAANERWLVVLLTHHLVFDHTSLDLLATELGAHMAGLAHALPSPRPYRAYVERAKQAADRPDAAEFFRRMLGNVREPTVPFGLTAVPGDGSAIAESQLPVEPALARRLRRQARALGTGTAALCHLAWARLLAQATRRDDVLFGTVLFGRLHGDSADRAMGLHVNTLPMRVQLGGKDSRAQVRDVHALLAELSLHEHAPLSLVERCTAFEAPAPLFTAVLNYRHSAKGRLEPGAPAWPGITFLWGEERTHFPVFLSVDDDGSDLALTAQTPEAALSPRLCDAMHEALERLAEALEPA